MNGKEEELEEDEEEVEEDDDDVDDDADEGNIGELCKTRPASLVLDAEGAADIAVVELAMKTKVKEKTNVASMRKDGPVVAAAATAAAAARKVEVTKKGSVSDLFDVTGSTMARPASK